MQLLTFRFIVAGDILSYIVQGSALPFRYDLEYELDQELTEDVSDHYPIETLLEGMAKTAFFLICFRNIACRVVL